MGDPLQPGLSLLVKLVSIVVHIEEALSPKGHGFDVIALKQLVKDKEVQDWINEMGPYAPIKR